MWTHYAALHRGIAIKYHVPHILHGKLDSVDYDKHIHEDFRNAIGNGNPFEIPEKSYEERKEDILKSVFLKNRDWKYENEVRYVKFLEKAGSPIEKGWKVLEIYLGCKYLENSDENLSEIEEIVLFCRDSGIKVYEMAYDFDRISKRYTLSRREWMNQPNILEVENYSQILRKIKSVRKARFLGSKDGTIIKELAKEIADEEFERKWTEKMMQTAIQRGYVK